MAKPKTLPEGWAWYDDGYFLIAVPPERKEIMDRFVWHVSRIPGDLFPGDVSKFTGLVQKLDDHDALVRLAQRVFKP